MSDSLGTLKGALVSCVVVAAAAVGGYYGYEQLERQRHRRASDPLPPAQIAVVYQDVSGERSLPPALLPAFELILDSSYSMTGELDGRPKHEIAQQVTKELLTALPDSAQVALRVYGHWGPWLPQRENPRAAPLANDDPRLNKDSELVIPLGPLNRERRRQVAARIDATLPRGKTPIVYSLLEARKDFPADWRGAKTVILLTDGWETAGGKLSDLEAAYGPQSGLVVHVVGFAIEGSEADQQLAQIARFGGGKYYKANGAAALADVLREAIRTPAFVVYDAAGQTLINRGLINGPPLSLPGGAYRVAIQGHERHAVPVTVRQDATLVMSADDRGALTVLQPRAVQ